MSKPGHTREPERQDEQHNPPAPRRPPPLAPAPAAAREGAPAEAPLVDPYRRRGRGARSNRVGRFEPEARESIDDGWEGLGDLAPFKTEVYRETAKSIIASNDSPDISF